MYFPVRPPEVKGGTLLMTFIDYIDIYKGASLIKDPPILSDGYQYLKFRYREVGSTPSQ